MKTVRVVACLDVKDGRVVKGQNFVHLKDQGDPVELARRYVEQNADELVFLDISATQEQRESTFALVKKVAEVVSLPFSVGGGIKSVADAERMIAYGAQKVGVNSAAIAKPELITQLSQAIGSEKVIVAIDVKKTTNTASGYEVVTHGGEKLSGIDGLAWAIEAQKLGAGEILLTSMESDGMKSGFDSEILRVISQAVQIPVTASGGAGELKHFVEAAKDGAAAVLAASVFHSGKFSIADVKNALKDAGFETN